MTGTNDVNTVGDVISRQQANTLINEGREHNVKTVHLRRCEVIMLPHGVHHGNVAVRKTLPLGLTR